MNNTVVMWMTGLVVLCILILLFLNAMPMIWSPNSEKYLKYNDVRGVAVEHKKKLYTLNFEQQNELIGFLNRSIPVGNAIVADKSPKLEVTKIVIYRFGLADLIIVPIEYNNHHLLFSCFEWNPKGLMKDVSAGGLENLLAQTFDP